MLYTLLRPRLPDSKFLLPTASISMSPPVMNPGTAGDVWHMGCTCHGSRIVTQVCSVRMFHPLGQDHSGQLQLDQSEFTFRLLDPSGLSILLGFVQLLEYKVGIPTGIMTVCVKGLLKIMRKKAEQRDGKRETCRE